MLACGLSVGIPLLGSSTRLCLFLVDGFPEQSRLLWDRGPLGLSQTMPGKTQISFPSPTPKLTDTVSSLGCEGESWVSYGGESGACLAVRAATGAPYQEA